MAKRWEGPRWPLKDSWISCVVMAYRQSRVCDRSTRSSEGVGGVYKQGVCTGVCVRLVGGREVDQLGEEKRQRVCAHVCVRARGSAHSGEAHGAPEECETCREP